MEQMNFIKDLEFDEYINSFKNLNSIDKIKNLENEILEIIILLNELNKNNSNYKGVLYNDEIKNLKKEGATKEEIINSIFVYINSIKELLANYIENRR